jgi:hypothetical protein
MFCLEVEADLYNLKEFTPYQGIKPNHIVVHRESKEFYHCTVIESRPSIHGTRHYYYCQTYRGFGSYTWFKEEDIRPVKEEEGDTAMGWLMGATIMHQLEDEIFADHLMEERQDPYQDTSNPITDTARLLTDRRPKAIDLFSGAGGFTLGLASTFNIVGHVEFDKWALATYELNAPHCGFGKSELIGKDITKITDETILGFGRKHGKINLIVGGPPCQGFSMSGKRDPKDPRNSLFIHYARFIKILKPDTFIMENVPGMKSMKTVKGESSFDIILNTFRELGYTVDWRIQNAVNYGVPQHRRRIIIIGNSNGKMPNYPLPTHFGKGEGTKGDAETKTEAPTQDTQPASQTSLCGFT